MSATTTSHRYTTVAIILHWVIAAMLVSMVFVGWWMEDLRHALLDGKGSLTLTQAVYNWHKTAGLIILVLSLARLAQCAPGQKVRLRVVSQESARREMLNVISALQAQRALPGLAHP